MPIKQFLMLFSFFLTLCTMSLGQRKISIEIDGQPFAPTATRAGIEKVMDKYFFAVVFSTETQSLALNISYDRIKGKTSAVIDEKPSAGYDRFEATWKPNKKTPGSRIIKTGAFTITGFDEVNKKVSGTFEVVLNHFPDEKGSMVVGKDPKTISIKGGLKEIPFTKVN